MGTFTRFWRRQRPLNQLFVQYLGAADQRLAGLDGAMREPALLESAERLRHIESTWNANRRRAKQSRAAVESHLCGGSLLPEWREDLLTFLRCFDEMPRRADAVVFLSPAFRTQQPLPFESQFLSLLDTSEQAYQEARRAADRFVDPQNGRWKAVGATHDLNRESRRLRQSLIRQIFRSEIPTADKLMLREVVNHLGGIMADASLVVHRLDVLALRQHA